MKTLSLETYLKSFFETEKKSLMNSYPGLTLHRLRQDLELFCVLNNIEFNGLYLAANSNPITLFFEKLKQGVPLEYITGRAYFYRSSFKVTKDTLIPRSETEILVELATQELQKNYRKKNCRIADIGTGSGAIAISLLLEDVATIEMVAGDISEAALKVARENYFNHRYVISSTHRASFVESDRLDAMDGVFDLILSNPPYIKKAADFSGVHSQVSSFEPHLALFLSDDTYDEWFKKFFTDIYKKLSDHGVSLVEGHEDHLVALSAMAKAVGFSEASVIKDYTNRNRFLKLKK